MHPYRSHTCAELDALDVGEAVRLAGWVHRVRDHGGLLFVDLRDHYGTTQVLADPDSPVFAEMERVRAEWCIRVDGEVKARDPSLVNPRIPTGEIEVFVRGLEVLGAAEELPLQVFGDQDYPEETRLRYRYLDLRREGLHERIVLRSDVVRSIRERMWGQDFREYQTPILTASSPEGARDFLVPSRLHPGRFYALPQAPQIFKQLVMVSGFDRYFQIAPCFRDEDPRADRSPTDFYQLDMEMSFVTQDDVFAAIQPVIAGLFEEFGGGKSVDAEWPRIPYAEAALKYGTDKPDLRNSIEMQDVSEHFRGSGFAIFAQLLEQEGTEVRAIPALGGGSRKFCDRMNAWAQAQGLPGMGYIFWRQRGEEVREPERLAAIKSTLQDYIEGIPPPENAFAPKGGNALRGYEGATSQPRNVLSGSATIDEPALDRLIVKLKALESEEGVAQIRLAAENGNFERVRLLTNAYFGELEAAGPLAKNIGPERSEAIRRQLGLEAGDAAFFLAGRPSDFEATAGRARTEIGRELGLIDEGRFAFAWIVDFPMYAKDEEGRVDFEHNPFSMPQGGLEALSGDPLEVLGYQYDLACNGYEIVSGAIRNHRPEIMFRAFEVAGYTREEVERRFPALPTAFRYGAPPHGGCAAGIDRVVMLLAGQESIREVMMFPMNQQAQDLMMGAPTEPTAEQLRELRLRVLPPE